MLDRASIFMIHRVAEGTGADELSAKALTVVLEEVRARGFRVVSLESIIQRYLVGEPQLPDSIAFTLDDGFRQQMDIIAPLLARYDCEATVFLITGYIDRQVWPWDYKIDYLLSHTKLVEIKHSIAGLTNPLRRGVETFSRDAVLNYCKSLAASEVNGIVNALALAAEVDLPNSIPAEWEPLTWEGARALESRGFRFAPHGVSHAILSRLPASEAEREIRESWKRVQEEVAFPCPVFAWPTGRSQDFGAREICYAKRAGLIGAVTASCDYALLPHRERNEDVLYRIGRFAMPEDRLDFLQYSTWIEHGKQSLLRRSA
jgi:peptidoglycan/xylan/chitin deacetylase (PgdA/CDA1 family)